MPTSNHSRFRFSENPVHSGLPTQPSSHVGVAPGSLRPLGAALAAAAAACLALPAALPAANLWDAGAGNGLWADALNWDDNLVPPAASASVLTFPAAATPAPLPLDLGGITRSAPGFNLLGRYTLTNGRLQATNSSQGLRASGDNTLAANYGTNGSVDFRFTQEGPGTLTVTGAHVAPSRGLAVWGQGGVVRFEAPLALPSNRSFSSWNLGHTVFAATSGLPVAATVPHYATRGTVVMNGSAAPSSQWIIDGGTLAGTGELNSPTFVGTGLFDPVAFLNQQSQGFQAASATLSSLVSPGDPLAADTVGTFTVNGPVTFGAHGGLLIELGAAGASDRLVVNGNLTVAAATALAVVPPKFAAPSGTYVIATWTGSGTFASPAPFDVHTLPPGYELQVDTVAKQVKLVPLAGPSASAENIVFPADSGVLDVTRAPFNAIPNDGLDDTAALQAALDFAPNGRRIVYLPDGTYDVSATLLWPTDPLNGGNSQKRTVLQGQSRDGAILRLADSAPGFTDPADPKPVLYIERVGGTNASQFRNGIRNLTVHTGSANPGAIGIDFVAHNQGQIERVKVVSGDGTGAIGLDLSAGLNGPLLVRDLEVHGFATGILTGDVANSITLENLRLYHQSLAGLLNRGQAVFAHDLVTVGGAYPVINGDAAGFSNGGLDYGSVLTLSGARFFGGFNGLRSAISGQGFATLHDVRSFGRYRAYERRVQEGIIPQLTGTAYRTAQDIPAYVEAGLAASTHGGTPRLGVLAPEPTPRVAWAPLSDWADVRSFGAVGDGSADDTAAIQAAIDSGKSHVYFPAGYIYRVNAPVTVRGAVSRLIGCDARFVSGPAGRLVVGPGSAPVVVIERMDTLPPVVHTARDLVVAHSIVSGSPGITSTASGRLFLDDLALQRVVLDSPGLRVFARQLNLEGDGGIQLANTDARVWVLGLKVEKAATRVQTAGYGVTEIQGFFSNNGTPLGSTPAYRILDSGTMFVAGSAEATGQSDPANALVWVEHTRDGLTEQVRSTTSPAVVSRRSANGNVLMLYGGPDPVEPPPPALGPVIRIAPESGPLFFDGIADRLPLDGTPLIGVQSFTASAWVWRDDGARVYGRIFSKATGVQDEEHELMLDTSMHNRFRVRVKIAGVVHVFTSEITQQLASEVWTHLALVYDGAKLELHQDGVVVISAVLSGTPDFTPAVPMALGNQPAGAGDRPFHGLIDDFRFYDRALSPDELQALVGESP
jgi:hypothetical protein